MRAIITSMLLAETYEEYRKLVMANKKKSKVLSRTKWLGIKRKYDRI